LIQLVAGPEEAKNLGGAKILRVIQIRLVMPSLANITPVSQANSLSDGRFEFNKRAQLFVGAAQRNAFRSRGPIYDPGCSPFGIKGLRPTPNSNRHRGDCQQ